MVFPIVSYLSVATILVQYPSISWVVPMAGLEPATVPRTSPRLLYQLSYIGMFGGSKNSAGAGTSLLETPRRVLFMQILHLEYVGIHRRRQALRRCHMGGATSRP